MLLWRVILFLFCFISFSIEAKAYPDFTGIAETQGAAVVNISITQIRNGSGELQGFRDDERIQEFFRNFGLPVPGLPDQNAQEYQTQSLGSGFIISTDGYVLTNAHVVSEADEILVRLSDKREFKAKVIGADQRTDIALLKVNATNLPKVTIGDPNKLKVGEWVAAIGSPFGLENTMTVGIVSAKGRALPQENYVPFIQTDAAVNPGNSGGPLFNLAGEVVGINSQIYSRSGGSVGLSFAIPIDVAIDVSQQIKLKGRISRGWLGIAIQELTKELAESFGLKKISGALIANIEKNSPAEKGGLEVGDIILKFDGKPIGTSIELPRLVAMVKPGQTVAVEILRKKSNKTLNIRIEEMPVSDSVVADANGRTQKLKSAKLGLVLADLSKQQKRQLGKNGAVVLEVQRLAMRAGIRRGDVILAINNVEVVSAAQCNRLLADQKGNIILLLQRGPGMLFVAITPNTQ